MEVALIGIDRSAVQTFALSGGSPLELTLSRTQDDRFTHDFLVEESIP